MLNSRGMGSEGRNRGKAALVVITAAAAPVALGFETLLRHLLFPADFELVREALRPALTPVAWLLCLLCAAAGAFGILFQQRMAARSMEKLPADRRAPELEDRARLGAFMLAASIPQVPAILATFTFMFGAALTPVLVAVVIVTATVAVQAVRTRAR